MAFDAVEGCGVVGAAVEGGEAAGHVGDKALLACDPGVRRGGCAVRGGMEAERTQAHAAQAFNCYPTFNVARQRRRQRRRKQVAKISGGCGRDGEVSRANARDGTERIGSFYGDLQRRR